MSAKSERQQQRAAKRLVQELKANVRGPGFLGRLCRWEQMRATHGKFTLQHRRD
jgi:hypothetical protein